MPKLTVLEELGAAIRLAAKDAGTLSNRQAAEEFCEAESKLIDPFDKEWRIEKVAGLIGRQRSADRREENPQMYLLGFAPPPTVTLKTGKKREFGKSTLYALKQGRAAEFKKHKDYRHPAVQKFDKAIALMKKHVGAKRGITYDEAAALELRASQPSKKKAARA